MDALWREIQENGDWAAEGGILLAVKMFPKKIQGNSFQQKLYENIYNWPFGVFLSAKQASALQNLPGKSVNIETQEVFERLNSGVFERLNSGIF